MQTRTQHSDDELSTLVTIPIGRVRLTGDLLVPSTPGGIVVFAHGSGSSRLCAPTEGASRPQVGQDARSQAQVRSHVEQRMVLTPCRVAGAALPWKAVLP